MPYGLDDSSGIGVRPEPVIGGVMAETGGKAYTSLEDPNSLSQRGDASIHITSAIPDVINDRPSSLRSADGPPVGDSNILFVDGLPTDCTRREVGRILTTSLLWGIWHCLQMKFS